MLEERSQSFIARQNSGFIRAIVAETKDVASNKSPEAVRPRGWLVVSEYGLEDVLQSELHQRGSPTCWYLAEVAQTEVSPGC